MLSLSKIQSYFFDSFLCINVKKKKKNAFNHERGGEEGGSTVRKGMSKMDLKCQYNGHRETKPSLIKCVSISTQWSRSVN